MTISASEVINRLSAQISAIASAAQVANDLSASMDDVYSAIEKCMAADCGVSDMSPLYDSILGCGAFSRGAADQLRKKQEDSASVYFIRREDGLVKIGYSHNPRARLGQLRQQHQCGMEIIATIQGAHSKEKELHRRFSRDRMQGEWFAPSEDLMNFISSVVSA